jgi:hypothetical protein
MSNRAFCRESRAQPSAFGVALAAGLVFALGVATACSIETAGLGIVQPAPESQTESTTNPRVDAASSPQAAPAGPTPNDGDASAPPLVGDGGASTQGNDAESPKGDDCDADRDGHLALRCAGGDDCCDVDINTHPGVTAFFATKNACNSFDYDCNGQDTREFPRASCKRGILSCTGDGFIADVACGVGDDFTTCSWGLLACSQATAMVVQRCR